VRQRFFLLVALALASFATGCVPSASVASVHAAHASRRYMKMYVTVEQGSVDRSYALELDAALRRALARHGVQTKTRIRSGLDLDDAAVEQEIKAWAPDAVLVVDFAGGQGAGFELESSVYDTSLIDAASTQRVWRAQARSQRGSLGTTAGMMQETASELTKRLTQDGFLSASR
jgi:hypothetical protein